jgi:predicted dehydrogenase
MDLDEAEVARVTRIGIGMVGHGFMGAVHSHAWRSVSHFFDTGLEPHLAGLCGRDPATAAVAAARFGWAGAEPDWRRLSGGGLASFEATRFAAGRKNALRIEFNGSAGSVAFDLETMNELSFYDRTEDAESAGFRRILVTEAAHPYIDAWWPPGHLIGYEHTFTHEVRDLLAGIATRRDPAPSFADGLQVQRVLAAVARSAANGQVPIAVS